MQLNQPANFTSSSLKRRTSDQATYSTAPKYARSNDNDQSLRRPVRPSVNPAFVSPAFEMPGSGQNSRSADRGSRGHGSRGSGGGFGLRGANSSHQGGGFGLRSSNPTSHHPHPQPGRRPAKRDKRVDNSLPLLEGPLQDRRYVEETHSTVIPQIKPTHVKDPKSMPNGVALAYTGSPATYKTMRGRMVVTEGGHPVPIWRAEARIETDPPVIGVGDAPTEAEATKVAALSLLCHLQERGMLYSKPKDQMTITLSDGSTADVEKARQFMDYYCHRYRFSSPELIYRDEGGMAWEVVMVVQGKKIGMGHATNKKRAQSLCYLDVVQYLEKCDPELWKDFQTKLSKGQTIAQQQRVFFSVSNQLHGNVRDLVMDLKSSELYRNRPADAGSAIADNSRQFRRYMPPSPAFLNNKSKELLERQKHYLTNPSMERMRSTRAALPVYSRAEEVLTAIRENDVTILMAATGSGKTTQIPQLILDASISQEKGATCNVLCTQPRRLAALSVADRVAKERGETLGKSVGYSVRFESKPPEEHGSITFCTTGVFLKRLQSALLEGRGSLDAVTHVVVDEVHERDVDTDLLLVVLKRLLADRKARNMPLKIILMSATIDPTLFQNYFPDDNDQPAKVIEVPGRTFPVTRHHLEDFLPQLLSTPSKWILQDDSVVKYVLRELGPSALPASVPTQRYDLQRLAADADSDIEIPYPLIAATIAHVLQNSDSGHVLTFLAGWDDITAVQKILTNPSGRLPINFNDKQKYSIHLLHSTIPLSEQQVIFEPPPEGVRRIILATNIAETSVTIPDVVYVVDSARLKEQRFDPEKHVSSLVSAWVGSSNMNQRAGRAGRHRSGEYYGVLSKKHASQLHAYQTVEMSRVDLSNVVMHIKALNFPGMAVEEVLAATIEPPQAERVAAAMRNLQMNGALDKHKNLTSLGRVLLQIPVDVQVGRLVLFGSFFRCLDQALTLAALLTNRDPFVSPMHLKEEAARVKASWCPPGFKSDALTALQAYNAWDNLQSNREYTPANRFCVDNFLAKPTLLLIQKLKTHLLQSLYHAGVIDISAGGGFGDNSRLTVPPELNENGQSFPLLSALIALASQPKFAVRSSEKIYRTQQDKVTMIHPSSVNSYKRSDDIVSEEVTKQIIAFVEKRRNVSAGSSSSSTFLVTTTRIETLIYMLFGAHKMEKGDQGIEFDDWIQVVGHLDALDDVYDLRKYMDACMLRVFEGIIMGRRHRHGNVAALPREEEVSESGDDLDGKRDYSLSLPEVKELDFLSRDLVNILNRYSTERASAQSRPSTRPATPMSLMPPSSGYSTPYGRSEFNSRASTPVNRLGRRF